MPSPHDNWLTRERRADPCQLTPHHIPRRFLGVKLEEIKQVALNGCVRKYLTDVGTVGLEGIAPLFLGKAGEMKTFAAACIAERLYTRALVQVEFVQCAARLPQLERLRFSPDTQAYLERLARTSFLVMDDFAQVRPGSWAADFCVEIAERRYGEKRPTLWTANIDGVTKQNRAPLENVFGVGFGRRVFEGAEGYRVIINS